MFIKIRDCKTFASWFEIIAVTTFAWMQNYGIKINCRSSTCFCSCWYLVHFISALFISVFTSLRSRIVQLHHCLWARPFDFHFLPMATFGLHLASVFRSFSCSSPSLSSPLICLISDRSQKNICNTRNWESISIHNSNVRWIIFEHNCAGGHSCHSS